MKEYSAGIHGNIYYKYAGHICVYIYICIYRPTWVAEGDVDISDHGCKCYIALKKHS